jgi:phosphorylcholine metabolism protein LicD
VEIVADRTFNNPKNVKNAIKLLNVVVSVLNKHNVAYYLDFGTLIGAMRENALISWDYDVDISLLHEGDYKKIPNILKEIRNKYGYRTYLRTFKDNIDKQIKRGEIESRPQIYFTDENNYQIAKIRNNMFFKFGRGKTCLDIFFKYEYKNKQYWMSYGNINSTIVKVSNLKIQKYYNMDCFIPENYDEYLTSVYDQWKVPNIEWTNENDCVSRIKNNV